VTRRLLLDSRGLAITADAVRHGLQARITTGNHPPHSLPTLAAGLLARARQGEIEDAHGRLLAEAEKEILTQAILLAEGNQAKAARWLGISRLTLREKLTQLVFVQISKTSPDADHRPGTGVQLIAWI